MSKKFIPADTSSGSCAQPSYQMAWRCIAGKEYSPAFLDHHKRIEEKVLKEARERALFVEKEGYEKGFAQGEKDGLELGEKRVEAILRQFENILSENGHQWESLYRNHEREMLQIILSICKKVLHQELTTNESVILSTLLETVKRVVDQRKIVVHLHPADHQHLLAHSDKIPFLMNEEKGVTLVKDPSITRGGCLMETAYGDIDGTMETQFDQIVSLVWQQFEQTKKLCIPEPT